MLTYNFTTAGLLAVFLSLIAIISWEFYLRYRDMLIVFEDNSALWASKRAMVYAPEKG